MESVIDPHIVGRERAQINCWQKSYEKLYRACPSTLSDDYALFDAHVSRIVSHSKKPRITTNRFAITINPRYKDVSLHAFMLRLRHFRERAFIKSYYYTIEIGDTKENYHAHMFVETSKKDGIMSVEDKAFSSFKNMIGNVQHIKVKPVDDVQGWLDYISKSTERTTQFREKHGIKERYTNIPNRPEKKQI